MVDTSASRQYTETAINSFFQCTSFDSSTDQFILIDNDNCFDRNLPTGEVIKNRVPLGFASNANQMIRQAVSEQADLYFLNNDLIFGKGWDSHLRSPDPIIRSPLSNREVSHAAAVTVPTSGEVLHLFMTSNPMTLEEYLPNQSAVAFIQEVQSHSCSGDLPLIALPFFCVKLPLEVMQNVGLFDESFGKGGGEDYDYALRSYLAGFGVCFSLSSWILHFGGKSSWSGVETKEQQLEREAHFFGVFERKWGKDLHDLILKEDHSIMEKHGLANVENRSYADIRKNIHTLLGGRQVELHIQF